MLAGLGLVFGGQESAATLFGATPTRVFSQELFGVFAIDDQAIVVVEFLAGFDLFDGFDEHSVSDFIRFAIGFARVVDPASTVAFGSTINHVLFIDVKKERVIGLGRIVRVSSQGLLPADHLTFVFNDDLTLGDILQGENTLAVYARLTSFNAFVLVFFGFGGGHDGGHFNKK